MDSPPNELLSVVVPARNGRELTLACLASLFAAARENEVPCGT